MASSCRVRAMVLPQSLQAYVSGSKIYGEYGDPWDVARRRELVSR